MQLNQLYLSYGAAQLVTKTGGVDRYWSPFKLRGTPARKRKAVFVMPESGRRGRLTRYVTGFLG